MSSVPGVLVFRSTYLPHSSILFSTFVFEAKFPQEKAELKFTSPSASSQELILILKYSIDYYCHDSTLKGLSLNLTNHRAAEV